MRATIEKAVLQAYQALPSKGWDKIYWAIDLHGTCIEANYKSQEFKFLDPIIPQVLAHLSALPESKIIIWSSCYPAEQEAVRKLFKDHKIEIFAFNENPAIQNTATGCFDKKPFYSIIIDDKAGFDWREDWAMLANAVLTYRTKYLPKPQVAAPVVNATAVAMPAPPAPAVGAPLGEETVIQT